MINHTKLGENLGIYFTCRSHYEDISGREK